MTGALDGMLAMGMLAATFGVVWSGLALGLLGLVAGPFALIGRWRRARHAALLLGAAAAVAWGFALVRWGLDGFALGRRHAGIATVPFFVAWPWAAAILIARHRMRAPRG